MGPTIPRPIVDCIAYARQPSAHEFRTVAEHIRSDLRGRSAGALAEPLQMDRLERAIIADADQQTAFQRDFARDQVAILKQLKGDDRTIYARMTTPAQPLTPPKRCATR